MHHVARGIPPHPPSIRRPAKRNPGLFWIQTIARYAARCRCIRYNRTQSFRAATLSRFHYLAIQLNIFRGQNSATTPQKLDSPLSCLAAALWVTSMKLWPHQAGIFVVIYPILIDIPEHCPQEMRITTASNQMITSSRRSSPRDNKVQRLADFGRDGIVHEVADGHLVSG